MKKLQSKQWLGILGFLVVLLLICLTFVFIVPLESYTTSSNYGLCDGSNLSHPAPVKNDYHLVKGQLQDYLNAKKYMDTHSAACSDPTVKLFL